MRIWKFVICKNDTIDEMSRTLARLDAKVYKLEQEIKRVSDKTDVDVMFTEGGSTTYHLNFCGGEELYGFEKIAVNKAIELVVKAAGLYFVKSKIAKQEEYKVLPLPLEKEKKDKAK